MKKTPLLRKTPLRAKKKESRCKRIPSRSSRRAAEERLYYNVTRPAYLKSHPTCECCWKEPSKVIHHKKGRIGPLLNDTRFFMAVSESCHERIGKNSNKESYKRGWMIDRLGQKEAHDW